MHLLLFTSDILAAVLVSLIHVYLGYVCRYR